jgi:hypothetical protein
VKKIKEIKEKKDEENSLLNELKFKSQAAMEYLMTYGWAILIIALSLVVLYSLGIMNPKNFIPRAPPGSCFVFRPNGPGTTDFVSLQGTCGYLPMYVASFNGVDSYIGLPDLLETTEGSVGLWINPDEDIISTTGSRVLFANPLVGPTLFLQFNYFTADGKATFGYYDTAWRTISSIQTSWSKGKWYHLVSVWGSGGLKIYVNGVVSNSDPTLTGKPNPATGIASIGRYSSSYFKGRIANVQIYNTALTQQEIQYLYQQGLGGGPVRLQNLVAWWPLNGDAKDYSGNNLHGTINGGVTFVQNYNPP